MRLLPIVLLLLLSYSFALPFTGGSGGDQLRRNLRVTTVDLVGMLHRSR